MTETPKDKREAALERIKALSNRRASTNAEPVNAKNTPGGGPLKGAAKHGGGPGHRPQGG
ncbi:MAG: hypothetical protein QOI80_938 [Solirubrobacteraceae bacterium]|jgi:hypothetical protein|nr:hypothetical protein [Solirubrobacteraceae bacterium]